MLANARALIVASINGQQAAQAKVDV